MKKGILIFILLSLVLNSYSQVVINEIFASNTNAFFEEFTYSFPGYIELYNKEGEPVDLSGYYLTNDPGNPKKWNFPSTMKIQGTDFYVIYCDEKNYWNHSNFKLDADGGEILLYNKELQIVDSITYGKQYTDLPYGRKPNGTQNWTRFAAPSAWSSNNNIKSGSQICPAPTITPHAGFYNASVSVSIQANVADVELRYTTDGSEPTENSSLYSQPIQVSSNTIVKAKCFHSSYLPGSTSCNTYLVNERKPKLPVVTISTNPKYLTDDSIGIYVEGKNGTDGNCYPLANWNQEWKRPAVFEYFDTTGNLQLTQGLDIKIAGKCSRINPQKSLALLPSSRYGSGNFDYPFFASKPNVRNYGSLMLRNSGNEFNITMFRDGLLQELCINQFNADYQAYQPVAVYLNGEYWGLMNLREKVDKNYFKANSALPVDSITLLERKGEIIGGTDNSSYLSFVDSLSKIDASTDAGYKFLNRNIDINEYLNYLAVEIFCENKDWPGNNLKFWKANTAGSKWRWIITDLDYGFGTFNESPLDSTLKFVTEKNGPEWPNPEWSTLLIRKVFENPVTRDLFIQKMMTIANTTFKTDRVNAKIDSIVNLISSEMPYHWKKYGSNETEWKKNIEVLRNFGRARGDFMIQHLIQFFKLTTNYAEVSIKDNSKKAEYFFNDIAVNDTLSKQIIPGLQFSLEAKPLPAYEFDGWNVKKYKIEKTEVISKGSTWKYYDKGTGNLTESWKSSGYNDALWKEGQAELGYGDLDEKTTIGYGGNAANKFIATAFRKVINITDVKNIERLSGELLFDDGAVIYVNGKEVWRANMPASAVTSSTAALVAREDDDAFQKFDIPKSFFNEGDNVIAVEVHQCDAQSSDLSFDFALSLERKTYTGTTTYASAKITDTLSECAEFYPLFKVSQPITGLVFNEVAASNKVYPDNRGDCDDWIEIYNSGNKTIDLSKVFMDYKGSKSIQWPLYNSGTYNLAPGAYALFWADDEISQGPTHLPFKLPGEGEILKLIQPTASGFTLLDSIKISAKNSGATVGRNPDGGTSWGKLAFVTPGSSNTKSPTPTEEIEEDAAILVYPNPAQDYFEIRIPDTDATQIQITLIGFDGRVLRTYTSESSNGRFDISHIKQGTYLLRISSKKQQIVKKIVILK
jgi:hypothetical protein